MRLRTPTEVIRRPRGIALCLALSLFACAAAGRAQDEAGRSPEREAVLAWQQGYVAHLQGDYRRAVELFRLSIGIRPSAEAHTFLGWSLSHLGRLEEAIAECQAAIRLDPDFGNPYNDIGVYLIALGRPDEAPPWFEQAIRSRRYCCYQFPHFNLGSLLLSRGRIGEARRHFERALEHDPDYVPARRALEALRASGLHEL